MIEQNTNPQTSVKNMLKNLSTQDFKDFGLQQVAYIRKVQNDNDTSYSIHAANGKQISASQTLDKAIRDTRKNSLEPITVH